MKQPMLRSQILEFVQKFQLVEEAQLRQFFSDWDKGDVEYEISHLKWTGRLIERPDGRLSVIRKLPMSVHAYEPTIRALQVLCQIPSHRIRSFWAEPYPNEVGFLTDDDEFYDITVFDSVTWTGKYSLIPAHRERRLPADQKDPYYHIAVLPNIELLRKVEPLGFDKYALISPDGSVQMLTY